ncbi:MAG: hypothetical protein QF467_05660 [SAR202 cluster bacterium]|jgi:hypothetical protein|nr:hypothetical protein [SAR202 cluster bacterium]
MSLLLVVLLLISGLAGGGCALGRAENPNNPSYRVVTAQVESIESAIGMQGGIGGSLRQIGEHGEESHWFVISGKVAVRIGLTVTARLIADRRDPRFIRTAWFFLLFVAAAILVARLYQNRAFCQYV